jgi:hypothetical protein
MKRLRRGLAKCRDIEFTRAVMRFRNIRLQPLRSCVFYEHFLHKLFSCGFC